MMIFNLPSSLFGFKALAKVINPSRTVTPNVVYINGVAGAGKTEVVLKNIR